MGISLKNRWVSQHYPIYYRNVSKFIFTMARGGHMSKPDGTASFTNTKANIHRTLTNTKVKATVMASKTSHLLVSLLSTVLTVVLVLAVSVFLYGTFYYAYMPVEMHHLPVHHKPDDSKGVHHT